MSSPPPGCSPPAAAAAVDEEEELLELLEVRKGQWPPPMKMNLAPYAMFLVFDGMGPRGGLYAGAYVGMHFVMYFVRALSLSPVAEVARFWGAVHAVVQPLCLTATVLIFCAFIRWYMAVDGVYRAEYELPPQLQPPAPAVTATVVEQLPPPPPEMDMC